jgi:NDP-sugar pyrophosphorylase family protein
VEAPEAYGTAGTLHALKDRLASPVVTYNSDVVADLAIEDLLTAHLETGAAGTVAVAEVDSGADLEAASGRPIRLIDRRAEPAAAGYRFLGIGVFESEALDELPLQVPAGLAEALLAPLIAQGRLAMHVHLGYARDISVPAAYIEVSLDLLAGRGPAPPGGSWPGEIVTVDGGVAYLGPGAEVLGELGAGAIVLAGARVAVGARVARSIVMPSVTVPEESQVRDTIFW